MGGRSLFNHEAPAASAARAWIGTPYVHGASVKGVGADCLGLLRGVWRDLYGDEPEPVPVYAPDWTAGGRDTMRAAADRWLKPVDGLHSGGVVLMGIGRSGLADHCGILAGAPGGSMTLIHACNQRSFSFHGVMETTFAGVWARRSMGVWAWPQ